MRLLLCWAVILDSLCCSTCNCLHSSKCRATAYMASVVSDGWSSPVPYASREAGHRALSNGALATATLHAEKEKGNRQTAPSQRGLQAPLLSNFWGSSQWRVTRGDSVSSHPSPPQWPCHYTQDYVFASFFPTFPTPKCHWHREQKISHVDGFGGGKGEFPCPSTLDQQAPKCKASLFVGVWKSLLEGRRLQKRLCKHLLLQEEIKHT